MLQMENSSKPPVTPTFKRQKQEEQDSVSKNKASKQTSQKTNKPTNVKPEIYMNTIKD